MAIHLRTISATTLHGITKHSETQEYMMNIQRLLMFIHLHLLLMKSSPDFSPYHDVSHDKNLAFKICDGFRPKIPFHTPRLITDNYAMLPTFEEL
ncbi:hypothetical protein Glove_421g84 [Diversispora epigaea]|uniref:Uncharacterized protein n=1 Tax=Diversispora epigaea TaxID=1348612 RepID=A0A397GZY3_9GLOM|nr:hypothetical protein Glove_421g84 [Diversispora epigaea]